MPGVEPLPADAPLAPAMLELPAKAAPALEATGELASLELQPKSVKQTEAATRADLRSKNGLRICMYSVLGELGNETSRHLL